MPQEQTPTTNSDSRAARQSSLRVKVAWVAGIAVCGLVVVGLLETLKRPVATHQAGTAAAVNLDYYSTPDGMTFRHVGLQWVRNDMEDCAGHDREALEGNPDYYPEICKLTADDASAADVWWKRKHPRWSVKAAYSAEARARNRWYKNHSQPAQTNDSIQPNRDRPASVSADEISRCLNTFPSDSPAKGEYMVRYRMNDPTCGETGHARYAVGYGGDPSEAALNYVKNRIPSLW